MYRQIKLSSLFSYTQRLIHKEIFKKAVLPDVQKKRYLNKLEIDDMIWPLDVNMLANPKQMLTIIMK